ncbi:MAG: hypothetical protein E6R03_08340 [Hyphomicrobiaceae bacterium]|nr:MAG: hypothetical protein E6R03_08340 [Hyphomicrobiaceae bacterium]
MTAGRHYLRATNRDAIIKNSDNWVWTGSRFVSVYSNDCADAIRFKDLEIAKQIASHLRKVIPGSMPRALRATYPEQAAFDERYKSIEGKNGKK